MAAVNLGLRWKKNLNGDSKPYKFPVRLQAGASQAIKQGEILDLTSLTAVAPLASDKAMSAIIAVADAEIRSGDLDGYRLVIIPRPGDVFEYALAAASAPAVAAPLYFSDSQTLKVSGSNIIGYVHDASMIPLQPFASVNPAIDSGTTLRTVSRVQMIFKASVSYWAALAP